MADLVVPPLGESITEAVIGKWLKNPGDAVEADEPVVDLETDKITVQLPAPKAGQLLEQRYAEGDTVHVGDVVGAIGAAEPGKETPAPAKREAPKADGKAQAKPAPAPEPARSEVPATEGNGAGAAALGTRLTPAQRRAQREGRIAEARSPAPPRQAPSAPPPAPAQRAPAAEPGEREEVVRMSPLRKRIAQRLVEAQQSTASLTTFNEVDMSAVMALRKRYQEQFVAEHGLKLGFMSFFVKAAVEALKKFPGINAEVRDDSIAYKKYYDLGIAVSSERGLIVPVLREADRLGFAEIEQGIADLAKAARDNKLVLDDLMGATFTITNGGIFGSMLSTPLLNFPQTGILGMHNIVERPIAVGGKVEIRPVMYIALTYDHRVVDGKEAVQFLVAIKERIEQPERLLFSI
jgi:2-oxoglutarate dehydrogenase E2 component (dihydrolipoamide succinyltransferase)